jgi:hypothetical protein
MHNHLKHTRWKNQLDTIVSLVLIGTTTQSCKQEPSSAPITNDEGTSVMIESSIQKKNGNNSRSVLIALLIEMNFT